LGDLTQQEIYGIEEMVRETFVVNHALEQAYTSAYTAQYYSKARHGRRLRQGLPVHGQRTRSNSKTALRLRGYWLSREARSMLSRERARRKKKQRRTARIQKVTRMNRIARGLSPHRGRTKPQPIKKAKHPKRLANAKKR